jgi:hypothetical protein
MKNTILVAVLSLSPVMVWAHGDHVPPVAQCASRKMCMQDEIEAAVPEAINRLIGSGEITKEWKTATVEKVETKDTKDGQKWVATVMNSAEKDASKQKLYILINSKGYMNKSNFTGEF